MQAVKTFPASIKEKRIPKAGMKEKLVKEREKRSMAIALHALWNPAYYRCMAKEECSMFAMSRFGNAESCVLHHPWHLLLLNSCM
eukprot:1142557-Pelagomonas_calceolata.AAC.2